MRSFCDQPCSAAVRLFENVGIKPAIKTLRALGIEEDLPKNMSLALGSPGIPLLSLVKAYAVIANQGEIVTPYAVQDIQSAEGAVIYERGTPLTHTSSVSKQALYELSLMMEDVITEGTGKRASVPFRGFCNQVFPNFCRCTAAANSEHG